MDNSFETEITYRKHLISSTENNWENKSDQTECLPAIYKLVYAKW